MKYYSKSMGGFYTPDIHERHMIPVDAVEITDEEWRALLAEQSAGKEIVAGTHGRPITADPVPTEVGILASRDTALKNSDWLVARHRDEMELDPSKTTLTAEQYSALQAWRRELRNITAHPDFPRLTLPPCPV